MNGVQEGAAGAGEVNEGAPYKQYDKLVGTQSYAVFARGDGDAGHFARPQALTASTNPNPLPAASAPAPVRRRQHAGSPLLAARGYRFRAKGERT